MIFRRAAFILFTEVIRVIITERFTTVFLKVGENRMRRILAYLFSILITTFFYTLFNKPVLNLLSTFLGLLAIGFSYSGTIKRKCMFVFCVLAISCLIDLAVYAVLVRTLDNNNYSTYASILSLLLLLAAQLIIKKLFGENINAELNNRHWLFYIASLLVCIITSLFIFTDRTISPLSLSIVCGAFLLVNIIISYLIDDLVDSSKDALENQVLRDQMRAYEREIILQNEKMEILRSFRHDMKYHFSEISALASAGDTKQIKKYVSNMDDNLKESTMLVDSGNTGLDTVLNYMLQCAADKDIPVNVRVAVPEELELSAYDMNIILGNLIENAIEAQKEVNAPRIDLVISYSMDSLIIELSNTYSHKVRFKEGLPVTTKRPTSEHGYGIRNVRKVLDKYTNTLDFNCSEDRFTVRILMKIL